MPAGEEVGRGRLLEPAHRIQPLLAVAVIAFHAVVQVAGATMLYGWQDRAERGWLARGLVRDHALRRHTRLVHGALEKRRRHRGIPPF